MPVCAAINCTSRQTRGCGKSFHRFPHGRPDVLKKWVLNMRRDKYKPSSKAVLCSDHFEELCFDRTGQTIRLRIDAVPTVFSLPGKGMKERKSSAHVFQNTDSKPLFLSTPPPEEQCIPVPNEKSITEEHDYCITDSPKTLKKRLDEALSSLHCVKRRLKITQQKFRRLKFKVQSLELNGYPV
ncbi:THAP domain-containing protein 2-like [Spea bombifrons]|uniref:THAP domain-containing protein 2-like n=1 Tax=Spea bombifrons TaxID=233779 RepID=UPI00234B18D9|nr:THAP domain-containing protein 2-like [Spea bombifrons]